MFGKRKTEVLVAGAGPVGLYTAASLAKRGVDVHIYDAEWQTAGLSYALAVHPGSVELLEELDIARDVLQNGYRVNTIAFYEGGEPQATMDLTALSGRHPFLTIVPQSAMERGLEAWLKEHRTKVEWKHRVAAIEGDARPTQVTMERWGEDMAGYAVARRKRIIEKTFPIQADFVIGADGHSSVVRRHLGIDYPELGEPALFAVFEFATDADLQNEVRVVLNDDNTNVLWPLPDKRCRWSFQLPDPEEFSGDRVKNRYSEVGRWVYPALDRERLESLIAQRAPWFHGQIQEIIWSVAIRFEQRFAKGFGRGSLWLTGDSVHLAGPVGVQSMNVGLREGKDLAERLESVLRLGAPLSDLEKYEDTWTAEWRRLFNLDGALRPRSDASEFVRKNAARILSCTTASGEHLEQLLGQVGLEFADV